VETVQAPHVTTPHVAGAGDSYLSGFILAYLNSRKSNISAQVATATASIAIRKEGTSTCSQAELKSYFNIHSKFISDFGDLGEISNAYRNSGKRIVFTNGCFDILHSGHVTYLHRAKDLGDVLIVGLNTDESIKRIKGENRPINSLIDRLQVLAGLSSVDHIVPFGSRNDDTPVPLIRIVRPHVFAKGGDYTKEKLPEAETVEAYGGEIVFLDHIPDHSTTRIINRITQVSTVDEAFSNYRP
jgi:D-beta-D-heptose 7-phosphate kinase/D-beta-D-heptose 1-phosphate adenosyltransferase